MPWTRRRFLSAAGLSLLGLPLGRLARAIGPASRFRMTRLVLDGLEEDPRPGACARLVWEVLKRTSIDADMDSPAVHVDDPVLYEHPFLTLFADRGFPPPSDAQVERLRRFLSAGGFLLADTCGAPAEGEADRAVRALLGRVLPDLPVRPLPGEHTVFRSFYLLDRPHGRAVVRPYLEGADRDDRSLVILSANDLPGAWQRDTLGAWAHPMASGGDREREMAFRLGVNVVMYSLCLNYKRDQVHVHHLLRKLQQRRSLRGAGP